MAGSHLAVVSAKKKAASHGPGKHKHPVKHMSIEPTDNGGYNVTAQMHPKGGQTANDPYSPGDTQTAAFGKHKDMMKHVASMLKTDAEEQGPGEGEGGDPGASADAA